MGKINLNFSQIGGMLKKLSFLRTYSMLLVPALIVVAAAAILATALFMGKSFRTKITKLSIPIGRDIDIRLNTAVPMKQAEVEKRYQEQFEQDANQIEQTAMESSQRELLDYDLFPEPNEPTPSLFTQFGKNYCSKIEEKIKGLNGGDSPTEEDIKTSINNMRGGARAGSSAGGSKMSDSERITEEFCMQRARTATIYVNPVDIAGFAFWQEYKYTNAQTAIKDCWDWQLGYWIIEDVLASAGKINEMSRSVIDSPVKRIIYIGFTSPDKMLITPTGVQSSSRQQAAQDKPKSVIKSDDMLAEPCTGRVSNADVNVIQFSIDVVVGTESILPFMKELCSIKEHEFKGFNGKEPARTLKHNQITILQNNIRPINQEDSLHLKYRYGNQPVVEMELVCEYVFNKKGYSSINPEMAISTQAAAATTPGKP
jgi:hypothetical protein